ncbi:MAG: CBS domain-containing protein [Thermoplasmata archaeon]
MTDERPIDELRVWEVLERVARTDRPATVRVDAPLREAVEAIIEDDETHKVYALDGDGRLAGTITLEVLLRHAGYMLGVRSTGVTSFMKMLMEITDERVNQVMAKPVKVSKDEMLVNATKLMVEHHLNDLPVVDEDDKLVAELRGMDLLRLSVRSWK